MRTSFGMAHPANAHSWKNVVRLVEEGGHSKYQLERTVSSFQGARSENERLSDEKAGQWDETRRRLAGKSVDVTTSRSISRTEGPRVETVCSWRREAVGL